MSRPVQVPRRLEEPLRRWGGGPSPARRDRRLVRVAGEPCAGGFSAPWAIPALSAANSECTVLNGDDVAASRGSVLCTHPLRTASCFAGLAGASSAESSKSPRFHCVPPPTPQHPNRSNHARAASSSILAPRAFSCANRACGESPRRYVQGRR
jgi:hypothetical protein